MVPIRDRHREGDQGRDQGAGKQRQDAVMGIVEQRGLWVSVRKSMIETLFRRTGLFVHQHPGRCRG